MVKRIVGLASVIFSLLFLSEKSYAYIDPGTGSVLLQACVAALAAVGVMVGLGWRKVRGWLSRLGGRRGDDRNHSDGN